MTSSKAASRSCWFTALRPRRTARRAASLTRLARSAPTQPAVARATFFRSTSSARRIRRVWTWRVARRPARLGRSMVMRRSKRPGRRRAWSRTSGRLVAALEKHSQPVSKITIVPHTSGALGYTMTMPEEEKFISSKEELLVELMTLLGGRAAEQTVFGVQTTGASNDIERATELAQKMVTQY
ncbi:MAG: hypothetical protein IJO69_08955, partial [Ruminiclostridium sp.]|nr:hypothetical protein [Ruminiclostridium sp.]